MRSRFLLILIVGMCSTFGPPVQSASSQTPPQSEAPYTILIDPVCPVSPIYPAANATKELRVLYFPSAKDATLKDAKSLSVQIVFNEPQFGNNRATVPFKRTGEQWEALVPLVKSRPLYAMFQVKDDDTGAVDDNRGKYWDVMFCSPQGDKEPDSVMEQADTYSGESWPFGMRRERDYGKAIALLDSAIRTSDYQKALFLPKMWEYEAKRDGDTPAAYAKVSAEVERYLNEHGDDPGSRFGVSNFVMNSEKKLPPDFVDQMVAKLDESNGQKPGFSFHAQLAFSRAEREPDLHKRLGAIDAAIAQYPSAEQLSQALYARLQTCIALRDVGCAESTLPRYRETSRAAAARGLTLGGAYLQVASLYAEEGVHLDAALKLTDEEEAFLPSIKAMGTEEYASWMETQIAETRARIYLAMRKCDLALAQAQRAMPKLEKSAQAHFLLAQAYAGTGQNDKAVAEYFNAALLPSNKDLEYRAALQRFYVAHFGNNKQFEAALHQQIADRFQATHYIPKLLAQPAPEFEFTTLKGQKFDSSQLNGKIVVINFWSPG